jgi:hypothetical protein
VTRSLSPVQKHHFGVLAPLLPETQDTFETPVPLSPEHQSFSTRAPLSHGDLAQSDNARAVSPLPNAEEFGIVTAAEEGPPQIAAHQPREASEPFGSSSRTRSELYTAISYMRLTLAQTGWVWGEPAPSPINSKQGGQPRAAGEVEHMYETVC